MLATQNIVITPSATINAEALQSIANIIQQSLTLNAYPGAVVLAGTHDHIFYEGVFGYQQLQPEQKPMQANTIFDIASLTKVVVTATAIMQLVEQNKLNLDASVASYWPAFAAENKAAITVKELIIHTSGLAACLASNELNQILPPEKRVANVAPWHGKDAALQQIINLKPDYATGTHFVYSDINFIVLGFLIELITQTTLDEYAAQHIFKPLGMTDSYFNPPTNLRSRIAPTQIINGKLYWGEVHDPTANLMGGVAGMAGVFSTAHDIARFAQMMLNQGRIADTNGRLLQAATVALMTANQTPIAIAEKRGLGWDKQSPYSCGGKAASPASYSHTGWTGTSLWVDPDKDVWLIILTSRTHPDPQEMNRLVGDRRTIADIVSTAVS